MNIQRDGSFYTGGPIEVFVVYEEYYTSASENGDHRISLELDSVFMYAHEADAKAMRYFEENLIRDVEIICDEPGRHGMYWPSTEETFIFGVKKFRMEEIVPLP